MKVRPFFAWIGDGVELGLSAHWDYGECRIGLELILFEVGLKFNWHLEEFLGG